MKRGYRKIYDAEDITLTKAQHSLLVHLLNNLIIHTGFEGKFAPLIEVQRNQFHPFNAYGKSDYQQAVSLRKKLQRMTKTVPIADLAKHTGLARKQLPAKTPDQP